MEFQGPEKDVRELTVMDLQTIPIWRWRRQAGQEYVTPTRLTEYTTDDSDPDIDLKTEILIVLTRFTLANRDIYYGYCSPWDPVLDYTLPVIILEGKQISLLNDQGSQHSAASIATLMGKPEAEVFPIRCETMVKGKDGATYSDKIDANSRF